MRLLTIFLLVLLASCGNELSVKKDIPEQVLPGDWLVLYAEHKLKGLGQREIYGRLQDSIIEAKGLKLVSFYTDHKFRQLDNPDANGTWAMNGNRITIRNGGKGFDNFKTAFLEFSHDTLQIIEYVDAEGEKIKLIWNLKKIDQPRLFTTRNNAWRRKASKPETDEEIKARLAEMLDYYSYYYQLIAKESIYFIKARVPLPFNYYQHAMGMRPLTGNSEFEKFFYDNEQARKAYEFLARAMAALKDKFPRGNNFVEEYGEFMGKMALAIKP